MFQDWWIRLRFTVLPQVWLNFRTDTAVWPLLLIPGLTWLYAYGRSRWGIAAVSQSDEVLKQLITLTSLLVTLVFAMIVPRLMADQDQRRAKLEEYRKLCEPLAAYGRLYHALGALILSWLQRNSQGNVHFALKHVLRHADVYELEAFFAGTIDSLRVRSNGRTINMSEAVATYCSTLAKQQALLLLVAFRPLAAKPKTFRAAGHRYREIYSQRALEAYNSTTVFLAWNTLQPMLLQHLYLFVSDSLVAAEKKAPAFYDQLRELARPLGLELAPTTDRRHWVSQEKLSTFITSSAQTHNTLAEEASDTFNVLLREFSPKKHYSLYLMACLTMLFGAVVPLGSLMFTTPSTTPSAKSIVVGISAIFTFSFVISFLINAIQLFASDPLETFD